MQSVTINGSFIIPTEHPSLAGHFPGNPVVPGVVLLDQVRICLNKNGLEIETLKRAKFIKPVRAEQYIEIQLVITGDSADYELMHEGELVASGQITAKVT